MNLNKCSPGLIFICLLFAVPLTLGRARFGGVEGEGAVQLPGGTNDGAFPAGGVVFDRQGNLYGVLQDYGPGSCAPIGNECGAVFQVAPPVQKGGASTETLLYTFQGKGANDGESPNGGLIIDGQGKRHRGTVCAQQDSFTNPADGKFRLR